MADVVSLRRLTAAASAHVWMTPMMTLCSGWLGCTDPGLPPLMVLATCRLQACDFTIQEQTAACPGRAGAALGLLSPVAQAHSTGSAVDALVLSAEQLEPGYLLPLCCCGLWFRTGGSVSVTSVTHAGTATGGTGTGQPAGGQMQAAEPVQPAAGVGSST